MPARNAASIGNGAFETAFEGELKLPTGNHVRNRRHSAIGSFVNAPNFKESAPASFPSDTPGCRSFPRPLRVLRLFLSFELHQNDGLFGPRKFGITPKTSKSNFSTWSPAKIV